MSKEHYLIEFWKRWFRNDGDFLNEIYLINLSRGKIFGIIVIIVVLPLLYFDLSRISNEEMSMLAAAYLMMYSHLATFFLSVTAVVLNFIINPGPETKLLKRQHYYLNAIFFGLMLMMVTTNIADIVYGQGIANILGSMMIISIVFYFPNLFSIPLYGINLFILLYFIVTWDLPQVTRENLLINLMVYGIFAFAGSRYLFMMKLSEYRQKLINQENENFYRFIFEMSPDPIVIFRGDRILRSNNAALGTLGSLKDGETQGRNFSELFHENERDDIQERIRGFMQSRILQNPLELQMLDRNGDVINVLATPRPITFEQEQASIMSFHDITHRYIEEESERRGRERAQQQRSAISRLAMDENVQTGDVVAAVRSLNEVVCGVLNCDQGRISLFDEAGMQLEYTDFYTRKDGRHTSGEVLEVSGENQFLSLLSEQHVILTSDVLSDPRFSGWRQIYRNDGELSGSAMVPGIFQDGNLIGFLTLLVHSADRIWLPDEESFAGNAVSFVGRTLVNRQRKYAEKALNDNLRVSGILNEILKLVNSSGSLDELYEVIHRSLSQIMDADNFFIALLDNVERKVSFPYFRDIRDKFMEERGREIVLDLDDPVSGTARLLRTQEALYMDREEILQQYSGADPETYGTVANQWLGVPVNILGKTIAALVVQTYDENTRYSARERFFLENVAETIAPAFERMIAEAVLAESRKWYQDLFEKSGDANLTIEEGIITDCNAALLQILGLVDKEQVIGKKPYELSPEKQSDGSLSSDAEEDFLRQAFEKGSVRFEWQHKKADGDVFPTEVLLTSILLDSGRNIIHAVIRDITDKKNAEKAMLKSQRLGAIGEMASAVAHDFNNSLQSIFGNLELANLSESTPEQIRQYLQSMKTAAEDAATRVQLLQRFGGKKQAVSIYSLLDINSLLDEVILQSRPLWKDRAEREGAVITIEKATAKIPKISGNAGELRSVLYNTVKNAIEAMPGGGRLTLSTSVIEGQVSTVICDTGVGMTEDVANRVFQPLFSTKGFEAGRGFGMSGSYTIINEHRGRIQVKSTAPEKGTCIEILLPAAEELADTQPAPVETEIINRPLNVLWVEDDEAILALAKRFVARLNHNGEFAESGKRALDLLSEKQYDLIISDIGMPEMNGWELAAIVHRNYGTSVKIALLTGWAAQIDEEEIRRNNIFAVLGKPVKLDQLKKLMADVINSGSAG